jgi:uncharacterized protein (TIGR01777 family)
MADPVVVTGATGLIGRRLVARLLRDGTPVRALSRSPSRAGLPAKVEVVGWDGLGAPAGALARARALVHLAGEPVFAGPLTAERRRRIRDSRVHATRSLVEALAGLPEPERPAALVCASAVGYYGSRGDEVLDEGEAPGEGFLAEVCIDWEEAAARAEQAGVRSVSLRIGLVLAAEGGALALMRLPFSLGLGARLGGGAQWMPWVHVDDVVGLALAAIADPRYRGAVNAVAPNPVTNRDFTAALARALGRPAFLRAPAAALRLLGRDIAGELLASRRVSPRAARANGYAFAHPDLAEALAAEL